MRSLPALRARSSNISRSPEVRITPGLTTLAVMPLPASSRARAPVALTSAAFAAEYSTMLGSGVATPRVPIVMILPHPRRRIAGISARAQPTADRRQDIASERRDPVLAGGLGEAMLDKRAGVGDQNVDRAVRQRSGAEQFGLPGDGEIAEQNLCMAAGPLDPLSLRGLVAPES